MKPKGREKGKVKEKVENKAKHFLSMDYRGQRIEDRRQRSEVRSQKSRNLSSIVCPLSSEQGSILIGVLWSLFFLTALALAINALIVPQLSLAAKLSNRVVMRYLAEAGVKRALFELRLDETDDYDALNEAWSRNEKAFKEVDLTDDRYFSVEYLPVGREEDIEGEKGPKRYGLVDEERKININRAEAEVLKQFFELVGQTSSQEATDIADSIVDWRDEDDEPQSSGAESPYYEALDPGYPCKNAYFNVLEELLLVKEMTQEIFDRVEGRLTVYGQGRVNLNTADALVFQSLGMRSTLAEKIVLFREGSDGEEGTEDDNVFNSTETAVTDLSAGGNLNPAEADELNAVIESGLISVRSDHFRGHSRGGLRDRGVSTEIVFVIDRDENIRYWREY